MCIVRLATPIHPRAQALAVDSRWLVGRALQMHGILPGGVRPTCLDRLFLWYGSLSVVMYSMQYCLALLMSRKYPPYSASYGAQP